MAKLKYINLRNRIKDESGIVFDSGLSDKDNPIFNFNQKFIKEYQSVSNIQLGQSLPYISLAIVDLDGSIIRDFNLEFFHKQMEMDKIKLSERFSDRPEMSLKGIEIKTTEASGHYYYTDIKIDLKIHKPSSLVSNAFVSFLFPGSPLRLEYGWNSPNDLLNQKEIVNFNVTKYSLNITETGEIDISIDGKGFNSNVLTNVYLGDLGVKDLSVETEEKLRTQGIEPSLLQKSYYKIKKIVNFINKNKNKKGQIIDENLKNSMAESYTITEKLYRENIGKNFEILWERLRGLDRKVYKFGGVPKKCITVGQIVETLCTETLEKIPRKNYSIF